MCSDDGFHQQKVGGTSLEDVQFAKQGGLEDVQVPQEGVEVGEKCDGENGDTFFDEPVDFEGDHEESDEENAEEDSDFMESYYGSDEDNPKFAKDKQEDVEQAGDEKVNLVHEPDYNSDDLESVHFEDEE
ncbi:hypothetical protein D8674_005431 [Pyrus ussuriensis x Pyrus communis]|uniref:Uncharacterized protein n=1 Tax=Pyrus ussuriensis x Pyrus communis TaxID=2448454 RepID=A0A5N5G554_9ROSA|nr:hypothetical protein D8674_005431 [Pyrus ussuriensis x Pyrus communis]